MTSVAPKPFKLAEFPLNPMLRRLYPGGPLVVMYGNEGGGTRKTTGIVNTAVELAKLGLKVGLGDGDQTMAASTYLGYGVTNRKIYPNRTTEIFTQLAARPNIFDVVMKRASLLEAMVPARTRVVPVKLDAAGNAVDTVEQWDRDECFEVIPNLHLILGSRDMAHASDEIKSQKVSDLHWLRRSIQDLPADTLDVVLLDSRGTFDTLELSELGAADYVVGCVKPDPKDDDTLHGLKAIIDRAQEVFEFSGGAAALRYILFNGHVTNRGKFYVDMWEEIRAFYDSMVLPFISENVQVAEGVKAQEPVRFYMAGQDQKVVEQFTSVAQVIKRDVELHKAA